METIFQADLIKRSSASKETVESLHILTNNYCF